MKAYSNQNIVSPFVNGLQAFRQLCCFVLIGVSLFSAQNGFAQRNCTSPAEVVFPFTAANVSTAGALVDFTGSCVQAGNAGEDYFYHFTLASQQCIKYEVNNFSSGAAVYLVAGCPGVAGSSCISARSCRAPYCRGVLEEYTLPAGDYYLVVKGDAAGTPVNFNINIQLLNPDNNVACESCNDQENCISCKNAGFEKMNFQGWTGRYGTYANPGQTAGFVSTNLNNGLSRHTIVTRGNFDSLINVLPVVPPDGGDYAVRLGNSNNGRQAEQLSYTIVVDSNNTNFIYKYAVVFEDPAHEDNEQPFFSIGMRINGQNVACAAYEVRPRPGLEGFQNGGLSPGNPGTAPGSQVSNNNEPMYYKNWTTVNIPLIDFIGQTATITFTTKDCSLGAHFGYAYLDTYCERLAILPETNVVYCDKDTITLTAPNGFANYLWSNGQQGQVIRVNRKGIYSVTCTTVTGCVVTLSTEIKIDTPPIPRFNYTYNCETATFQFNDQSVPQDGAPIAKWEWSFGDGDTSSLQNPTHKYAVSGNYAVQLRVFTGNGCFRDTTIIVPVFVGPQIDVLIDGTAVVCNGATATLTARPSGGKEPYTYLWNNGSTASTITVAPGKYWLRATDASGYNCSASDTIVVVAMPPIAVNIPQDSVFACSATDARAVTAVGTGKIVSYAWSNGDAGATVLLLPGKYTVTAFDSLGCNVSDSVVVVMPNTVLSANISEPQPVCFNTTGTLIANPTGGYGAYTYLWNTTQTTKSIVQGFGNYCVTISDAKACQFNVCGDITQLDELKAEISGQQLICATASTPITVQASGGQPAYSYLWSTGQTSATINVGIGTYTVQVSDASAFGCIDRDTIVVNAPVTVTVNIPQDTVFACSPTEFRTVTAIGSAGVVSYLWSNGDGGNSVQLATGKYYVTAFDSLGCSATDSVVVVAPSALLSVDILQPNPICAGGIGEIVAQGVDGYGGYQYRWDTGDSIKNIFKGKGLYCATVTDMRGCKATACGLITELDTLEISITGTTLVCNGARGDLQVQAIGGKSPYRYLWSSGETTASISNKTAGNYTVTVTDSSGYSCKASLSAVIAEVPVLSVKVPTDTVYACDSLSNVTVTATGGAGAYRFVWSTGDAGSTVQLPAGRHIVSVIDSLGCKASDTVVVISPAKFLNATLTSPPPICAGTNGTLVAQGLDGFGSYTYKWATGETTKNITKTIGTYCVTVSDLRACTTNVCGVISDLPVMQVSIQGNDLICTGTTTNLNTTVTGGKAPYTYLWSTGETSASLSNKPAGNYSVMVSDNSGYSCKASANFVVRTATPIAVNIAVDTLFACTPSAKVNATAMGSGPIVNYTWSTGDGGASIQLAPGKYTVTAKDSLGCSVSDSVFVTQPNTVLSATVTSPAPVCFGTTGTILSQGNGGYGAFTYKWESGETSKNITKPAGTYCVIVSDSKACTTQVCGTIAELPLLQVNIQAPAQICNGALTNVAAIVTGGKAPYTYLWNTGETTASLNNKPAGTYNVLVSDASGYSCKANASVSITEVAPLTVSVPSDSIFACDSTSIVTVTAQGGSGTYRFEWSNGDSGPTVQLKAGKYTVSVVDDLGCKASDTIFVVTPAKNLSATVTPPAPICFGANGQLISQGFDGYGSYTYKWATGETTKNITKPAGTYCVTVSDFRACSTQVCGVIVQSPVLDITILGDSILCKGATGSLSAQVKGGNAPYTYLWSTGATTASISGLNPGTYMVRVSDSNTNAACVAEKSFVVKEASLLKNDIVVQDAKCKGASNGTATAFPSGGVAPYQMLWLTDGTRFSSAVNLAAGKHYFQLTDKIGCTLLDSFVVAEPLGLLANVVNQKNVSCADGSDASATVFVTGGVPTYTYSWSPRGGNAETATGLSAGSYILTATDSKGCELKTPVLITQPAPLKAVLNKTDLTCFESEDGKITATVSGGTLPYNYVWLPNVSSTQQADDLPIGTYGVTVSDANNCITKASHTISQPVPMTIAASALSANCELSNGIAVARVISGGFAPYTYKWNAKAQNQSNDTAYNLAPGEYEVEVTDSRGCSATTKVTVGNKVAGTATIASSNEPTCFGGDNGRATVSMSGGTAPYTYQWFRKTSGIPLGITTATASSLTPGEYFVQVTDAFGCVSISGDVIIENPPKLDVVINSTNVKCYEACDGTATAIPSGGKAPYAFAWNDFSLQTTQIAYSLCNEQFQVVVTDDNGCKDSASVTITQPTPINLDSSVVNTNCNQASGRACVLISGGESPYTVLWPEGQTEQCVSNLTANTYVVKVTDNNLCEIKLPITVGNINVPDVEVRNIDTPECFGDCDGSITVGLKGDTTFFTVEWDASTGNQTSVTASGLCAGVYTVKFTTDKGCVASKAITIKQPEEIEIVIKKQDPLCNNSCDGSAFALIRGGVGPYTMEWRNEQKTKVSSTDNVKDLCPGEYELAVIDANGCSKTQSFTLLNPLPLQANYNVKDVSCNSMCDGTVEAIPVNGVSPFSYQWDAAANMQTSRTALGLCAGTYSCEISDRNNCKVSFTAVVNQPDTLIAYELNKRDVSCNGLCDGVAEVRVVGGTGTYVYNWSKGVSNGAVASNLCAGTITAQVSDANGCIATKEFEIKQPEPLVLNVSSASAGCLNACQGNALAEINGGTFPYSVVWNTPNSDKTSFVDSLCAGNYDVFVKDANGCEANKSVAILAIDPFLISESKTQPNCGQENGEICVTTAGGQAPFEVLWSDARQQTSFCADSLKAGCYQLKISDAQGCVQFKQICIDNISGPLVEVVSSKDVSCFDAKDGFVEFKVSGGTGQLTTMMLDKDNKIIANNILFKNKLEAGCYTLIATDGAGCRTSTTVCISEPQPLSAFVSASSNVNCFGACDGSATLKVTGGTQPFRYNWSGGSTPNNISTAGLCAGNYNVLVTDSNACQFTASVSISSPSKLLLDSVAITNLSCFEECDGRADVYLKGGSSPYTYNWSNGAANASFISGLCENRYSVNVTDRFGCTIATAFNVNQPSKLLVNVEVDNANCSSCNGVAKALVNGGTGPFTYDWNNAGTSPKTPNTSGLCAGNYTLRVNDKNNCQAIQTVVVSGASRPRIDSIVTVNPTCFNFNNGSATVFASGGSGKLKIQWDSAAAYQTSQTAFALTNATYCVKVTDETGCNIEECFNIANPTKIELVTSASKEICKGERVQLYAGATGGSQGYTISWNDTTLKGFGPHNVSPVQNTNYCFFILDKNGCKSQDTCVDISVIPDPQLVLKTTNEVCKGDTVKLQAKAFGGKTNVYTWQWKNRGGGSIAADNDYDESNINVTPDSTGYYYVNVVDGCGQPAIDSVRVFVNPIPELNLDGITREGCAPFNAELTLPNTSGNFYTIDFECDGKADYFGADSRINHTYKDSGQYDVCVKATTLKGCKMNTTLSNFFSVYPTPQAKFTFTPEQLDPVQPLIDITDLSTGAAYMMWDFGDGYQIAGTPDSILGVDNRAKGAMTRLNYTYSGDGMKTIVLKVNNEYGCVDIASSIINIAPVFEVYVPNAFTPDGDGDNDFFVPQGIGFEPEDFKLMIYDRWGEVIYTSNNYNDHWDGKVKGTVVKNDVYIWVVEVRDFKNKAHRFTGHVTVFK